MLLCRCVSVTFLPNSSTFASRPASDGRFVLKLFVLEYDFGAIFMVKMMMMIVMMIVMTVIMLRSTSGDEDENQDEEQRQRSHE